MQDTNEGKSASEVLIGIELMLVAQRTFFKRSSVQSLGSSKSESSLLAGQKVRNLDSLKSPHIPNAQTICHGINKSDKKGKRKCNRISDAQHGKPVQK